MSQHLFVMQIAESMKQKEYQTLLNLGFDIPSALHLAWDVYFDVMSIGVYGSRAW